MKLAKIILAAALILGGLLALNTPAFAQSAGSATRRSTAQTSDAFIKRFQTALGETNKLSDAAITKIKPVLDAMLKKQTELRADKTTTAAALRTKRTAIATEAINEIKALVTADQFKVIQQLLQRGGNRGGGTGATPDAPQSGAPPQA